MKLTEKMMDALKTAGIAKEWHKGDMHRLYIDLAKASELYHDNSEHFSTGKLSLNRYERNNGKVWIEIESGEICTKCISSADEVISQIMELVSFLLPEEVEEMVEPAATEDDVVLSQDALTVQEIYDLCKEAHVVLLPDNKSLKVSDKTPADIIRTIRAHKAEIVEALSGYCFSRDVYASCKLHNWSIVKVVTITDVSVPNVTVFSGTAQEVDAWARWHKDDPYFTDRYTAKYCYCRMPD